ncbi:MAG: hypothetical protein ACRDU8_02610 [Egibacteraceae bacterium]
MLATPMEDGLSVVDPDAAPDDPESAEERRAWSRPDATDLESLRDEFIDGFNARDLEALLGLVHADVECPDIAGDGVAVLAEELESIWERSPGAILTRAFLDDTPCAVAWLPDEDGCWTRAALVCFDVGEGLLNLVAVPDDPDALDRAEAEDPTGEELEEWSDWSEWDSGAETPARARD